MSDLHALVVEHGDAVLKVTDALRTARNLQWDAPHGPAPLITSHRPSDIADPTARLAVDADRLQLRQSVAHAEAVIAQATAALGLAHAELDAALVPYLSR